MSSNSDPINVWCSDKPGQSNLTGDCWVKLRQEHSLGTLRVMLSQANPSRLPDIGSDVTTSPNPAWQLESPFLIRMMPPISGGLSLLLGECIAKSITFDDLCIQRVSLLKHVKWASTWVEKLIPLKGTCQCFLMGPSGWPYLRSCVTLKVKDRGFGVRPELTSWLHCVINL